MFKFQMLESLFSFFGVGFGHGLGINWWEVREMRGISKLCH